MIADLNFGRCIGSSYNDVRTHARNTFLEYTHMPDAFEFFLCPTSFRNSL